jgi:hypothetical protein
MGALDFSDGSRHETNDYVRFYGEKHAESSQPVASGRAFGRVRHRNGRCASGRVRVIGQLAGS